MSANVTKGAVIVGAYRYALWRIFRPIDLFESLGDRVCFVMLNPSKADGHKDDPTLRRCIGYARAWGYAQLDIVNLFAYRTTYPRELLAAHRAGVDIVGRENNSYLANTVAIADITICAWGRLHKNLAWREREVMSWLPTFQNRSMGKLHALKILSGGAPAHPLRLGKDLQPIEFST